MIDVCVCAYVRACLCAGRELERGGQCYCVSPRIADLDEIVCRAKGLFPEATIMVAHGEHADVEDRLLRFSKREADILVRVLGSLKRMIAPRGLAEAVDRLMHFSKRENDDFSSLSWACF